MIRFNVKSLSLICILCIIVCFGLFISVTSTANASSNSTDEWFNTFGGPQDDAANGMAKTSDGGYIITGYTSSYGNGTSNVWLVKTDANGIEQWNKTYGGTQEDVGYSVVQTDDGGYAVAGYTTSYGNGSMMTYLLKTDSMGNLLWDRTFGAHNEDGGYSLAKTSDGGYVITGFSYQDDKHGWNATLIKTDANGILQWSKMYGGGSKDCGHSVIQTADGGYAIIGYTKSYGNRGGDSFGVGAEDVWLIKTDANGNMQWNRTYGGKDYDDGYSILQDPDGGFAIAGTTKSYMNNTTTISSLSNNDTARVYLIKTDAKGNELWNKTFGGQNGGNTNAYAFSLTRAADGGYLIVGTIATNNSSAQALAIRTDSNGTLVWANSYGGDNDTYGYSSVASSDGGFVITGYSTSFGYGGNDIFLYKIADGSSSNTATAARPSLDSTSGSFLVLPLIIGITIMISIRIRKNH